MRRSKLVLLAITLIAALIAYPAMAFAAPKISAGFYHGLYLHEDGTLWSWGATEFSRIDEGIAQYRHTPEKLLEDVESISAGGMFNLALTTDHTLWSWGSNFYGQLGDGTEVDRNTPDKVLSQVSPVRLLEDVTAVSSGGWHSLALKNDGTVWSWGRNDYGQLGDGTTTHQSLPQQVPGLVNITAIAAGGWHSMALSADGNIYVWGYNDYGQLGDGTTTSISAPKALSLDDVTLISAGYYHSLAVLEDGSVMAWGVEDYTPLDDTAKTPDDLSFDPSPQPVPGLTGVKDISAGYFHSLALKEDGTVWAWGNNRMGQLGNRTTDSSASPVQTVDLNNVIAVSAGGYQSFALQADGTGWSWGSNEVGELGDGSTADQNEPVRIKIPGPDPGPGPGPGPGSGGSGSRADSGTSVTLLNIQVFINDVLHDDIATGSIVNRAGQRLLNVTLDEPKLSSRLAAVGDAPTVVIKVNTASDQVTAMLSGDIVEEMADKNAVLQLRTPIAHYIIPTTEIGADRLLDLFDDQAALSDINVHLTIGKGGQTIQELAEDAAQHGEFTVIASPVEFSLTVRHGNVSETVDTFFRYVTLEMPLPDSAALRELTTAVLLQENGGVRHVPTRTVLRDGKFYAAANTLSNSAYALISHDRSFSDLNGHWGEDEINDLASRKVVFGADAERFMPGDLITRAELTAMIVRALGIGASPDTTDFHDVNGGEWFADELAKAHLYGIITGYEDGTFKPDEPVTREEAIVMVARALRFTDLDGSLSSEEVEATLSRFADGRLVQDWARRDVAAVAHNGLVIGSNNHLMPEKLITRAEKAVIVWRLLQKAGLID